MISAPYYAISGLFKNPRLGWVGMDIGRSAIHLAQVEKSGNRYTLESAWTASQDENTRATGEGKIGEAKKGTIGQDPRQMIEGMIDQAKRARPLFSHSAAALTLVDDAIDYREFEVEVSDAAGLDSAVQQELEKELGQDLQFSLVKAWELPSNRKSQQRRQSAAVVAVEHELSMWLGERVTEAGYTPEVLDALPCALARSAQLFLAGSDQSCLVVHIGNASTTVTQVQNGQPIITRVLSEHGFDNLLVPLGAEFSVRPSDVNCVIIKASQNAKETSQQSGELREILYEYQLRFVQSLATEIYRTLEYIRAEQYGNEPTGIILCGSGSVLPNVSQQFEQLLELPTETWSLSLGSDVCLAFPISLYAVAAGLSAIAWE